MKTNCIILYRLYGFRGQWKSRTVLRRGKRRTAERKIKIEFRGLGAAFGGDGALSLIHI